MAAVGSGLFIWTLALIVGRVGRLLGNICLNPKFVCELVCLGDATMYESQVGFGIICRRYCSV